MDAKTVVENVMFGCSEVELRQAIEESLYVKAGVGGHAMLAMAILSDAQEVLEFDPDKARQFINKAKFIIAEYLMKNDGGWLPSSDLRDAAQALLPELEDRDRNRPERDSIEDRTGAEVMRSEGIPEETIIRIYGYSPTPIIGKPSSNP